MKTRWLFIIICLSVVISAKAEQDSLLARQWFLQAENLMRFSKYDQALDLLGQAEPVFKTHELWTDYIKSASLVGWVHFRKEDYNAAEEKLNATLTEALLHFDEQSKLIGNIHYFLSAVYSQKTQFDDAIAHIQKAIGIIKNTAPDGPEEAKYYNTLGIIYFRKSDYQKSLETHLLALQLKIRQFGEHSIQVSKSYNNLGLVYSELEDYEAALSYFDKSFAIKKSLVGLHSANIADTYNNMGFIYRKLNNPDKAQELYKKALVIEKAIFGEDNLRVASKFGNLSSVYLQKEDYKNALLFNNKAMEIWKKQLGTANINCSRGFRQNADIYVLLDDFERAFPEYQASIKSIIHNFKFQNNADNPTAEQLVDDLDLFHSLRNKADAWVQYHEKSPHKEYLLYALATYQLAAQVIDLLHNSYREEASKLFLQAGSASLFEDAIEVCHQLWESSNEQQYLDIAFAFSEKNKSTVLYSAMQADQAIQVAGIPDEILQTESLLQSRLSTLEDQLFREKGRGEFADTDTLNYLSEQLFHLKEEHQSFISKLEKKYPAYFDLKYDLKAVSTKELQTNLSSNSEQILEYFFGGKAVYIFSITKSKTGFYRIATPELLKSQIAALTEMLSDNALANQKGNSKELLQNFIELSFSLYQQLLDPVLDNEATSVAIIPDGLLYALPFDLLITGATQETNFSDLPFLLKKEAVRYNYTAKFLYQPSSTRQRKKSSLVSFAPEYSKQANTLLATRAGFSELKFAQEEAALISEISNGKLIVGENATEARFVETAPGHSVLHLAMHAFTDDENPMYSGLMFSNSDHEEDNILYAYELYNLKLDADLVVLSACNTGAGKLAQGEGTMSLARAFRHAGCPNILMSLWQADDETTRLLMESFYQNLLAGLPKDEALRQAKLNYLNQTSRKNFPHFWGTFVLMGDTLPIELATENTLYFWMAATLIVMIIIGGMVYGRWLK